MTQKIFVRLLLSMAIIFATSNSTLAEDRPVRLNVPHSYNLLIDVGYCKAELKKKNKETVILSDIIDKEKDKVDNLFQQSKICAENYEIKEQQAKEWKAEHAKVSEELIKALDIPWWKFDFKSIFTGSALTVLLILVL